jgi:hypothetical protein
MAPYFFSLRNDKMQTSAALDAKVAAATRRAKTLILIGAFASFCFSVGLWFTGLREEGLFVGLWVPSILSLGSLILPANRGGP